MINATTPGKLTGLMAVIAMAAFTAWLHPEALMANSPAVPMMSPLTQDDTTGRAELYTCPMHPSVRQNGPGKCPICGMTLTPVRRGGAGDTSDTALFHVSPSKQQAIGVKYETARVRVMDRKIRTVGNVETDERKISMVHLRYAGWIETLNADFVGKFVSKGTPLFDIYSPEALSAQREYLLSRSFSNDSAWTVDDLLGGEDFDAATRDKLKLLDFTDEQIRRLDSTGEASRTIEVLSPITGFVIGKEATAGMYVEPGMNLYTIADLSTVWLQAEVYQGDLPEVRVGEEAVARFSQFPGRDFHGRVTFIQPVLSRATRSVKVRIEIPNEHGELKPDMFGDVEFSSVLGKRLAVPVDAVMQTGTREIVYVNRGGGGIEARIVRTGVRAGGYAEILSGLGEGESVIASANFLIDAESRIQGVLDRLGRSGEGEQPPSHSH